MSIGDIADEIHNTVTMMDVLRTYCPEVMNRERRKRIPCPLHNGNDNNFSYSDRAFRCFVCNEGGDTIAFVQKYLSLPDRKSAMERMNVDMNLNLSTTQPVTLIDSETIRKRREKAEEERRKKEEAEARYNEILDRFTWAEKTKRTAEPFSDEWCEAVRVYDLYSYLLESEESKQFNGRHSNL